MVAMVSGTVSIWVMVRCRSPCPLVALSASVSSVGVRRRWDGGLGLSGAAVDDEGVRLDIVDSSLVDVVVFSEGCTVFARGN